MKTLLVAVLLAAPSLALAKPPGWNDAQVVDLASELAKKIGTTVEKKEVALERLRRWLEDRPASKYADRPIRGVFAYQMGEGGFIVKGRRGKGLLRLHGGSERSLRFKSLSVGAEIGGSSEWGVAVVLGLANEAAFGGDYSGSVVSATAGGASTNVLQLAKKGVVEEDDFHQVVLIGTSSGLSASAGGVKLTIVVEN